MRQDKRSQTGRVLDRGKKETRIQDGSGKEKQDEEGLRRQGSGLLWQMMDGCPNQLEATSWKHGDDQMCKRVCVWKEFELEGLGGGCELYKGMCKGDLTGHQQIH